jgi:hypothetical protein
MIAEPSCYKRKCKHFLGIVQPDGTEQSEMCVCNAFPFGIPNDILSGKNLHSVPYDGQENTLVYEKAEETNG